MKNKIINGACLKVAGVVGTGIHLYSQMMNCSHFQGIYEDIAEGRPGKAFLKVSIPYLLPYVVSYYTRKKTQTEYNMRVMELEERLSQYDMINMKGGNQLR